MICTCTDQTRITPACICHVTDDAVAALAAVRACWRNQTACQLWLSRPCPRLGGVPLELIHDGHGAAVVAEARKVGQA